MSDFSVDSLPGDGGDAGAGSDVSGDSSAPDVSTVDNDSSSDAFADQNFDKEFGLQPEENKADDSTDVDKAADPPANRQGTEVAKEGETEAKTQGETVKTPEEKATDPAETTTQKDDQFQANEKLNWEDDKVPFREEFKNLKGAYLELLENSVEAKFINNPSDLVSWMKETSPTSFNEVGKLLVTESAQSHPKEWIDYLVQNNPDTIAEAVSGREGMTADRLKAELAVLLDEDDEDVQAKLDEQQTAKAADAKPEETPEQKEIREWREERARERHQKVVSEVFQPIETAVDALVSEAGLEINDSDFADKKFDDLDPDTQFKVLVNSMIPMYIDMRVKQDPKLLSMQGRLEEFLKNGDVASAKKLQHAMTIAATNYTGEFLSLVTGKRAVVKGDETKIPAKKAPKALVKSAGATNGFAPESTEGKIDWSGE